MYKVNIYSYETSKSNMGAEAQGTENYIHRRNLTTNFIRSPSVEVFWIIQVIKLS